MHAHCTGFFESESGWNFRPHIHCSTQRNGTARPASRDTWLSWLQFGSGAVIEEMSPYREDQVLEVLDVLRRRVNLEGWKVVAKCGRRNRYEIRGRAWKFWGTLVALISPDNDNYIDLSLIHI